MSSECPEGKGEGWDSIKGTERRGVDEDKGEKVPWSRRVWNYIFCHFGSCSWQGNVVQCYDTAPAVKRCKHEGGLFFSLSYFLFLCNAPTAMDAEFYLSSLFPSKTLDVRWYEVKALSI